MKSTEQLPVFCLYPACSHAQDSVRGTKYHRTDPIGKEHLCALCQFCRKKYRNKPGTAADMASSNGWNYTVLRGCTLFAGGRCFNEEMAVLRLCKGICNYKITEYLYNFETHQNCIGTFAFIWAHQNCIVASGAPSSEQILSELSVVLSNSVQNRPRTIVQFWGFGWEEEIRDANPARSFSSGYRVLFLPRISMHFSEILFYFQYL